MTSGQWSGIRGQEAGRKLLAVGNGKNEFEYEYEHEQEQDGARGQGARRTDMRRAMK
jgi:hypothetical protein